MQGWKEAWSAGMTGNKRQRQSASVLCAVGKSVYYSCNNNNNNAYSDLLITDNKHPPSFLKVAENNKYQWSFYLHFRAVLAVLRNKVRFISFRFGKSKMYEAFALNKLNPEFSRKPLSQLCCLFWRTTAHKHWKFKNLMIFLKMQRRQTMITAKKRQKSEWPLW